MITVVIPAYNVADHITRTLASLEDQKCREDLEVIVVDDGSVDATADRISAFAEGSHLDFRFIQKENGGVSSARNLGLREAAGKYIYFLDGDDYVDPAFFRLAITVLSNSDPDILVTSYTKVASDGTRTPFEIPDFQGSGREFLKLNLEGGVRVNMCTFIFRTELLRKNGIWFDIGTRYGEDIEFYHRALLRADNVKSAKNAHFLYVERLSSASFECCVEEREEALAAIDRVQAVLDQDVPDDPIRRVYRERFYPSHVLKIGTRMAERADFRDAAYIFSKYAHRLAHSSLSGREKFKARLSVTAPLCFSVFIWISRKLRIM